MFCVIKVFNQTIVVHPGLQLLTNFLYSADYINYDYRRQEQVTAPAH